VAQDYICLYSDLGVRISQEQGDEAIGFCCVHKDVDKASFSFNKVTGLYKCFVPTCKAFSGGAFEKFHRLVTGNEHPDVPFAEIEKHHQALLKNHSVLKWLREVRGITEETVKQFLLGYDGERLWIPISVGGRWVNVRKHSPNKKSQVKTLSYRSGFGTVKLWPDTVLKGVDHILLCEGELDCILANQLGFPAMTVTGGAGTWKDEFTEMIKHLKEVDAVYDIDLAGRAGAALVLKKLSKFIGVLKDVRLPITSPANGDLTDYIVTYGATAEDLKTLIKETLQYVETTEELVKKPQKATMQDISHVNRPELLGQRIQIKATISGIDASPYVSPKEVLFTCKTAGSYKYCNLCPLFHNGGKMQITIPEYSQDVLRSIDVNEDQQKTFLRKITAIYPACPRWEYTIQSCYMLYDVRLTPEISYSSSLEQEYTMVQAFAMGHHLRANHTYYFEGTPYPNPKNQYMTLLLDKAIAVKDNLADFKLTPEQIEALTIFQLKDKQVAKKIFEIANDLSINITNIYSRENLVVACILAYHSALNFFFQGKMLQKGRVDVIVIGDTRCGKSETFISLINHFRAGELITGENTSYAGLVGGTQQMGSRWITTWGKLPMNDRRLLILDEVSGMEVEDIGKMSGVRSSGIAEIVKIQSEKIFARSRAIWSGNPRSNKSLSGFDTGVQALMELIGRPEDIARFDLAIGLMSGEVALDKINILNKPQVPHQYTSELCHLLVMWAWSRRPEQIVITRGAEELCLQLATTMSQRYSSTIPLVEGAEQRIKLIRLATACAISLFSTEDGETVVVEPEHVQFVHDFLEEQYSGQALNYLAYSKIKIAEQQLGDESEVKGLVLAHRSLIDGLLDHQYIRLTDLEDILNMDKKEVKPIISQLLKNKAIKHYGSLYTKTPAFITLLRKLQVELQDQKVEVEF